MSQDPYDAVIVGAGIAGLSAARSLQRSGLRIALLEARSRLGGRLHSQGVEAQDQPLDLGASWVWPHESRVQALLVELGLGTFPQHEAGHTVFDGPAGPQVLPAGPSHGSLRVAGGTAQLAGRVARELLPETLRLDTPAKRVQASGDLLEVLQADGLVLSARQVLLALPPALAMAQLHFEPGLPGTLQRLARATPVWMGAIAKTLVRYPRPFWRERKLSGSAVSRRGPLQEIHDHSGSGGSPAALFGFTGLGTGQPAPKPQAILAQLTRLFGPEAQQPDAIHVQDWSRESYTSPDRVAQLADYGLFGHPAYAEAYLGGRLRFCSAETAGSNGHIEDALTAAERAAQQVLAAFSQDGRSEALP